MEKIFAKHIHKILQSKICKRTLKFQSNRMTTRLKNGPKLLKDNSTQMTYLANKHMKRCSIYVTREFQIKMRYHYTVIQFSSVQWLSRVRLFVTPWTVVCQTSLSINNSQSLLKLMSNRLVMPSNHLILCHPLLPSIFSSLRVFSNESVLSIR